MVGVTISRHPRNAIGSDVPVLGVREPDKRFIQFDAVHVPPLRDLQRETLNRFDHYLDPWQNNQCRIATLKVSLREQYDTLLPGIPRAGMRPESMLDQKPKRIYVALSVC